MIMEYENLNTSFSLEFGEVQHINSGITPRGTVDITENGEYDVATYKKANVNVPIPDGYIQPAGTLAITENGKFDVTEYAEAEVKVSGGGDENFVGVKLSNFAEDGYMLPRVADARSLQKIIDSLPEDNKKDLVKGFITSYLFANTSPNPNGGLYGLLEEVYVPDGLIAFYNTFQNCGRLKKIHGDLSFISNLGSAFDGCKSLTDFPYLPNVIGIANNSFRNCVGLTKAYLYKKQSTFAPTAFSGCTNLLDIYVPWSEGEVANAPWGATNATIHYNTVYDENHEPIV